jgi:magnesium-transporting ATPase (P-type)
VDASAQTAEQVAAELGADLEKGLTADEAGARLERYGPNELEHEPGVPAWRRFLAQFTDPLVLLLLGAIAVSFVAWVLEGAEGVPFEALVILAIVVLNAVLGFVQEARAEQAVAALQRMTEAQATVVRDGEERRVPARELVPGDVLVLGEGDAIGADGRLARVAALQVAEAALTGESQPVLKDASPIEGEVALGDRLNMVFSGTAVASGRGRAVVTTTGMDSELGRIAGLLQSAPDEDTPLQREITYVGGLLGRIVILIAVVVVGAILLTSGVGSPSELVDVLLVGVSLAVAAVPEGLPAILSVVLALGVQRLARSNAIVKHLSSVETLGSASVICSDKTGTLTRNEMTVTRVLTPSGEVELTGTGYAPEGEAHPSDPTLLEEARRVLAGGSLASNASVRRENGAWTVVGDPTEAAIVVARSKVGAEELEAPFSRVGEVPFTSERKLMSTLERDAERDEVVVFTKGAPDVLLGRCAAERRGEQAVPLTDQRRTEILAGVDRLAAQALRPLAVAMRRLDSDVEADERVERDLVFLGLVGIIDPPREEARVAIGEAQHAGIRVIMITGDHPLTAARIAEDLGLAEPGAAAVTGLELGRISDEQLRATVRERSVFARVAPEHKLRLVDALQANGELTAMTGDGVNDAPALRQADIGIAMGITGTDVSKEAADMILADDNFATIVRAVREGRGIYDNIRKFLRFLLSSNIGEVLTMFLGVVLGGVLGLAAGGDEAFAVPLLATQILWINLLTDTFPALALGIDPPAPDLMERPPRRRGERVIDREMQVGIAVVGAVMAAVALFALDLKLPGGLVEGSADLTEARTAAFTVLVLAQLFNCLNSRSDRASAFPGMFRNPLLWGAMGLSLLLQVLVVGVPLLNRAFSTSPLSLTDWLLCAALASAVLWVDELRKLLTRRGR